MLTTKTDIEIYKQYLFILFKIIVIKILKIFVFITHRKLSVENDADHW